MLSIILQLSRTLKKAGVHVVTARNGQEAYDILQNHTFDVVLCDIHMPVMNGLEFVSKFREWEQEHRPNTRQTVYVTTRSPYSSVSPHPPLALPLSFSL